MFLCFEKLSSFFSFFLLLPAVQLLGVVRGAPLSAKAHANINKFLGDSMMLKHIAVLAWFPSCIACTGPSSQASCLPSRRVSSCSFFPKAAGIFRVPFPDRAGGCTAPNPPSSGCRAEKSRDAPRVSANLCSGTGSGAKIRSSARGPRSLPAGKTDPQHALRWPRALAELRGVRPR